MSKNNERVQTEIQPNPTTVVEKFLHTVWEHSLLNDETRKHRAEGLVKFQQYFIDRHFDLNNIIGLLVGSSLWGIDASSDYDFLTIVKTWEDHKHFTELILHDEMTWPHTLHPLNFIGTPSVVEEVTNVEYISRQLVNLLLTPDKFVAGNLKLAQELRLEISSKLSKSAHRDLCWQEVQKTFQRYFVDWRKDSYENEPNPNKRSSRFGRLLNLRSELSRHPERFRQAFEKTMLNIQIPDLATYCAAIQASKGVLSLE